MGPNGQEQGKFLSLDLGGTNFRVIFMELTAQKEFMMDSKIYAIPHSVMIGPGVELFDHIADCLMSCAWRDNRCRIGLILGTGTNACYLEDVKNIETLNSADFPGQEHMVINTEWGAFGDNGEIDFIKTKWDENVDEMSVNPGKQIFEKMISGMYMGELIRQVLVDLMKDDLIFVGADRERLLDRGSFFTRYASEIESDPVGEYTRCRQALEELGMDPDEVSDDDCSALRYVCEAVSRRASMIASAGITALLKKMDYKDVVIAIDGSLFRFHPHFKNVMQSRISQLMGINYKFDLLLSEDGSGRGAALVAAVLKRGDSNQTPAL